MNIQRSFAARSAPPPNELLSSRELPQAEQDKSSIFHWLEARSPEGAAAWLDAYDSLIERLKQDAPSFGLAPESQDFEFDVRQALFKTRRGRVYRALFFIDGRDEIAG